MIKIAGTGRALPANRVLSADLDTQLGRDVPLAKATGVVARYVCDTENQIDLAVAACQAALDDADLIAADIDLVISGSAIPYQSIPATAPLVMRGLGIPDGTAGAFDVNSTCLGFLTGVDLAAGHIARGRAKKALVFASELASRALPWSSDPETAALFGDGAGAAVLTASNLPYASLLRTYPSAYDACRLGAGGTRYDFHQAPNEFAQNAFFEMDGKALFRVSAAHFSNFVTDLLTRAGWTLDEVDVIIPHQASPQALAHMTRQLGIPHEKVVNIAAKVGNQIAASLPFTLDFARTRGLAPAGSKTLMLGTSAGVSFGGMAIVL